MNAPFAEPAPRRGGSRRRAESLRRRPGPAALVAALCGGIVVTVHFELWPGVLQYWLRSWALHTCALTGAAIATAAVLGFFHAETDRQRCTLRRLGVLVPLGITVLHELGQSLWPHDEWTLLDTLRDVLLNGLGAAAAWWVLRERGVNGPASS